MGNFYHSLGLGLNLLDLTLFFKLDLQMMNPVNVLFLFCFKLVHPGDEALLCKGYSRKHLSLHFFVLFTDFLYLFFVPQLNSLEGLAVGFFDFGDSSFFIFFGQFRLQLFLKVLPHLVHQLFGLANDNLNFFLN